MIYYFGARWLSNIIIGIIVVATLSHEKDSTPFIPF